MRALCTWAALGALVGLGGPARSQSAAADLPLVLVDRDDVRIERSCRIAITKAPLLDDEGDGVVQIVADGVRVEFGGARLHGAPAQASPDVYDGIGVRITARDVTLRGAVVSGYRGAIWATRADGLVIEGCDVSANRRQRLRSGERAEDGADWLWPHENDANQWLVDYGAGIYVEESRHVTVRACRARRTQNGLLLRRVDDSRVVDNDFSFLSGWGLGMFRCNRNVVQHNAFDFCVRGYSHGYYSRGQDSAGILFFEQNHDNLVAFNSATHSGDGFFGFAGRAALEGSEVGAGVGCTGNVLYRNDFSYAPAIGIEMTFSFDNEYVGNRLVGSNYGIWGGYSSRTRVAANEIAENEIAGIAVEHGSDWSIERNAFRANRRGVELWWDEDAELLAKPWAKVNPTASRGHRLIGCRFEGDRVGLEIRGGTREVRVEGCAFEDVVTPIATSPVCEVERIAAADGSESPAAVGPAVADAQLSERARGLLARLVPAQSSPVGARAHLAGRDKIVMTEWGPYDWEGPYLRRVSVAGAEHVYRVLGETGADWRPTLVGDAQLARGIAPGELIVRANRRDALASYRLSVELPGGVLEASGVLVDATWRVRVFPWQRDPREDLAGWRAEASKGVAFELGALELPYQSGGASDVAGVPEAVRSAGLARDRFGTLAETELELPAGKWRVRTVSDDGLRVWLDDAPVIERWNWHPPTEDRHEFELTAPKRLRVRVEHFEIDGWAVLSLAFEPQV